MMVPFGILQMDSLFANPVLSMEKAENILASHNVEERVLILPELAFTGYCFSEKGAIEPLCEDSQRGLTSGWARKIAQKNRATVIVGFPEKTGKF